MRRTLALAAVPALAFALAACGGDDDDTATGSGSGSGSGSASAPSEENAVTVVAESVEGFDSDSYEAAAGEITIAFENNDAIPHNVVVEDQDFRLADDGEQDTIELDAGEYTLFCDVPGHRDAGMEATLLVS